MAQTESTGGMVTRLKMDIHSCRLIQRETFVRGSKLPTPISDHGKCSPMVSFACGRAVVVVRPSQTGWQRGKRQKSRIAFCAWPIELPSRLRIQRKRVRTS